MKKFFAIFLIVCMVITLCACGTTQSAEPVAPEVGEVNAPLKVGFIFLHDEQSTYDLNFLNSAKEACSSEGAEYIFKTNVPEGQECYDAACELADEGCSIVFADSFGHEDYMIQAAQAFPNVEFCHATGTQAHTVNLPS